jgi:hypothetical protein
MDNRVKILKEISDQSDENEVKGEQNKKLIVNKRLTIAICLLLKENPVLPLSFNFQG